MADSGASGFIVIGLTMLAGMVLAIVPIPQSVPIELGFLRPDWVAMILVYWIIAVPHRVGVVTAWVVGIAMDTLLGSLLGQHALAYVLLAYISINLYQRLRMFTVWQQALVLFALLGLNQLLGFWIQAFAGDVQWRLWYLMPALVGAFLWPWVFLLLRYLRRSLGVA